MLHDQGGDWIGGPHDSDQWDSCSQLLFCIDVVERLLRPPFNAKEEQEGEKCQNSSICHLNGLVAEHKFKQSENGQNYHLNICTGVQGNVSIGLFNS